MIRRHSRRARSSINENLTPKVNLWILRILSCLGGHREFINKSGFFSDEELADQIGLGSWIDKTGEDWVNEVRKDLKNLHQEAERKSSESFGNKLLANNIKRLGKVLPLTDVDKKILEFSVALHDMRVLARTSCLMGELSSARVIDILAVLLDSPVAAIKTALLPQGVLTKSGIVSLCIYGANELDGKLEVLSPEFADILCNTKAQPSDLLTGRVFKSSAAELSIKNYKFLSNELSVLVPFLKNTLCTQRKGVNIYIYGMAGTGKSQFARVIADHLNATVYEVCSQDTQGNLIKGEDRLKAFRAAQCFFSNRETLLIFDEAEDVFHDGGFFDKSTAEKRKAWMNKMLEENDVPTFWLSNSGENIDPAFVRRFDMVFEMPVPSKECRNDIIKNYCGNFLDKENVERVAESNKLAPAVVAKAASIIKDIKEELGDKTTNAFDMLINNTLKTQGYEPVSTQTELREFLPYEVNCINSNVDLINIAKGLIRNPVGRLCLYGPPGTGKTKWVSWLATKLNKPLVSKKASNLLSMYVGGSEELVANAFSEAKNEKAILQIDEVDSFLQGRQSAKNNWEISLVNEMLTQMEDFNGIFIASTNLIQELDQAALRRFDIKIKFDYLSLEQAWALLNKYCKSAGIKTVPKALKQGLAQLNNLTPGDFATIARRNMFLPLKNADNWLLALEEECSMKKYSVSRPIGFITS